MERERKRETVEKRGTEGGGGEDAGENSCTFNYDQEVFTKGWRRCSSVALVNLAPDAVYCVERLLYTIIVHIQLPLLHLICIIGSLMKLALWNKKYKKSEMKKVVWCEGCVGTNGENNMMSMNAPLENLSDRAKVVFLIE